MYETPDFIRQELIGPYGTSVLQKLDKIIRYYKIYENGAAFEIEPAEDYTPARLHSKQIKKLINKQAQFAFGKPPECKINDPKEPVNSERVKVNEAAAQKYVDTVLKANSFGHKLIQGGKDCFIGGRIAIKLNISEDNLSFSFVPACEFVYDTDIDDVDKINKIIYFYTLKDDSERLRQRIWVQKYRMENGRCLLDERITDGYGETVSGELEPKINYDTKLDRIPAYVIVNDGLSGDADGESDVENVMADDSWYNKMRSANLDSLRKSMNQITYISGADEDTVKGFRNAPGAIVDVRPDSTLTDENGNPVVPTIGTLSNKFEYATAYGNTLAELKQEMHDVLGIPDISLENLKSIITSGKAMKAIYWPLITRCEEKMTVWKPALEWLVSTLLYAASVFPGLKKRYGLFNESDFEITIDNRYPLPENEDEEKALDMQEVSISVRSIKSYLTKWGGTDGKGLTPDEAEEEIKQMAKEKQLLENDSFGGEMNGQF